MVPVIGITSSYDRGTDRTTLSRYYIEAVAAAGGLPLVIPCLLPESAVPAIFASIDGLVLSGGVDVDPLLFGEEPLPAQGEICPERDRLELALTQQALERDMPILAICRGVQLLNVAAGGTVVQDIASALPNPLKHDQEAPKWYGTHTLNVLPTSQLASIWGEKIVLNSFHHQAVGQVAEGFIATAWATDGVIEAIESPGHRFVLGVQSHPECMWDQENRILQLFKRFVEAASHR